MADFSDSEEESFVIIGQALEEYCQDEPRKKPISIQDLPVKDSQGRARFHGAFTGGFSAGYFNTVGSEEGWTPSSFMSSRTRKTESHSQNPEDFMDDEDFSEHGIAPRKIIASDNFKSEERSQKRKAIAAAIASDSAIPGGAALIDLIIPERLSIGVKLLRKMGWKEGQGLGPRLKRQKKKPKQTETGKKIYGCVMQPSDSESEASEEEFFKNVTFAPKDCTPISFEPKDNLHGLGYRGINPAVALYSGHVNLFEEPSSTTRKKSIRGKAFGVGALEDDDDDDIYILDSMSNYDRTTEMDTKDEFYGWTAPEKKKHDGPLPVDYVGKILQGFTLSSKPLEQKEVFKPPVLPQDFQPHHFFKNTPSQRPEIQKGSGGEKMSLNAVSRSMILGESRADLVFSLLSKEDQEKLKGFKHGLLKNDVSTEQSSGLKNLQVMEPTKTNHSHHPDGDSEITTEEMNKETDLVNSGFRPTMECEDVAAPAQSSGERVTVKPFQIQATQLQQKKSALSLAAGGGQSFRPFAKEPAKQERYERYQLLLKAGRKDAYDEVVEGHMTEWECSREKGEFAQAVKFYKPLAESIASRFTAAQFDNDDMDTVAGPSVSEEAKSDKVKAAEMKLFGKLTRDTLIWHPDRLLCKRFNIPDPYPGSVLVGIPKVKRDKFSVFNFLSYAPSTSAHSSDGKKQDKKSSASIISSEDNDAIKKDATKVKPSIFSSLEKNKKQTEVGQTAILETSQENNIAEERPPMDLFKEIFADSDTDHESSSEANEDVNESAIEEQKAETPKPKNSDRDPLKDSVEERVSFLPGDGVQVETAEQRLSPVLLVANEEKKTGVYGPALPPTSSHISSKTAVQSPPLVIDLCKRSHHHKHRSKHKNKHKKTAKSKHKKSKHKKREKQEKMHSKKRSTSLHHGDSSEDEESGESTEKETENMTDKEILFRLKSLSSTSKWRVADVL